MRLISIVMISVLLLLVSCKAQERSPLEVTMYNSSDDSIGTATFAEQPDGVQVKVTLEGLKPGLHGIHVHEYPKCESPDFKSAGNHLAPGGEEHGLMHPEGSHLGDLPNIEVGPDGTVDAELMVNGATLMDDKNSLLKSDGTSLVVHEKQDDGVSQPGGDSGKRIACGVISLEESNNGEKAPTDPTESNEEQQE